MSANLPVRDNKWHTFHIFIYRQYSARVFQVCARVCAWVRACMRVYEHTDARAYGWLHWWLVLGSVLLN